MAFRGQTAYVPKTFIHRLPALLAAHKPTHPLAGGLSMRDRINQAVKDAMKSGDKARLSTLRLVTAAIKDRELGIGGSAPTEVGDAEITAILQKMLKQRRESTETYEKANRRDLADKEKAEIAIIEEFLPKQMDEAATRAAVAALIAELGASGAKDMGKVMGALKQRYAGQMDVGRASAIVKELLK
jgi:uncharacterized protein